MDALEEGRDGGGGVYLETRAVGGPEAGEPDFFLSGCMLDLDGYLFLRYEDYFCIFLIFLLSW